MRINPGLPLLLLLGPCAALLPEAHIRKDRGSTSWISTRACRWLGVCEKTQHCVQLEREGKAQHQECHTDRYKLLESKERADTSDQANKIPTYVLDYAPLVYLHSGEKFWPCDITEHLKHVTPHLNYTPMAAASTGLNLTNLNKLNEYTNGRFVYLTSDDNVEERPDWLEGERNIPDDPQELSKKVAVQRPLGIGGAAEIHGGHSDAPAVLVVINKGHGIVDAFWFFFYSYNLGNLVFNVRFGNHIGDWEHTLVRFINGKPKYVFVSEHYFGQAYTYSAVEKLGKRPVIYSGVGTHAMYATPGAHPYVLPLGLLHDQTDRGPLWDPTLNSLTYRYDHAADSLLASNITPTAPTEWFYFNGHWGDKFYPMEDTRQYQFAGQYHYVNGPLGPRFKHLGRKKICQGRTSDPCVVHNWLPPVQHTRVVDGMGEGEDWNEDERDPPMNGR
ncbi:MAG: hypothetical protein Q9172_004524 [Xanthocarpia lactea]